MKAAVLVETGEPLQILSGVELPTLLPGHVKVKIHYAGVCHSQLCEVKGERGEDKYLPHMLGHEGVGEVVEIGSEVSKVNVGDKVVLGWIKGKGKQETGAVYSHKGMIINSGAVTTFSEITIVSENRVVPLPDGIPEPLAVLLGCALPTGLGLVFNEAQLPEAQSVAVIGLGGIGLSALIAAKSCMPSRLIAIDMKDHKLELAKQLGATDLINSNGCDIQDAVYQICPDGVDYCFEAAGTTETIESGFSIVRTGGGQCIFASHPATGNTISLDPFEFHLGKNIKGSWGGGSNPDEDIPKFVDYYRTGTIKNLQALLSKEYSLEEINEALRDLDERRINRALIKFTDD